MAAMSDVKHRGGDASPRPPPPAPTARPTAPPTAPAAKVPEFGTDPRRVFISAAMQVAVVAFLLHYFLGSAAYYDVKAYLSTRFGEPCGLLPQKEFVLVSDRVVRPFGTYPGYGEWRMPLLLLVQW